MTYRKKPRKSKCQHIYPGIGGWEIPPKRAGIMAQNAKKMRKNKMLYFSPGSHAEILLSLLSVVGEYPMSAIHLLGNERVYKAMMRGMCEKEIIRNTETGKEISTKILAVSGKGADKTIRLYKGALPILEWLGASEYYMGAFDNHRFRGDRAHRERNHRVAEAVAMSMMAGIEFRPYRLAALQNSEVCRVVSDSPVFYPAKLLKSIGAGETNKTMFTRTVGVLFAHGNCYAVYNTRGAVMKWNGMGEFKTLHSLMEIARLNAGIRTVDTAILFGVSDDVALQTLLMSDESRKKEFRFDTIYRHILFFPQTDFGIRRLRLIAVPDWQEKLLDLLFEPDTRSYNRGQFEYDAYVAGKYVYSHLDGDIARLIRFREALEDGVSGLCEILCFPEQVAFLRNYLGECVTLKTIRLELIENAWNLKKGDRICQRNKNRP